MANKKQITACDGLPIRCFTCGKLIGHLYQKYLELVEKKKTDNKYGLGIIDDNRDIIKLLGLDSRYCCYMRLMQYPLGLYDYV